MTTRPSEFQSLARATLLYLESGLEYYQGFNLILSLKDKVRTVIYKNEVPVYNLKSGYWDRADGVTDFDPKGLLPSSQT